eukprot:gene13560-14958_t
MYFALVVKFGASQIQEFQQSKWLNVLPARSGFTECVKEFQQRLLSTRNSIGFAHRARCLMTADSSEDENIRPQGLEEYEF